MITLKTKYFNRMKTLFILVFCCVWGLNAQDSTYVKDYSHKLNVRNGIDSRSFSYKIKNANSNRVLDLKPNQNGRLTLGIVYRYLVFNTQYGPGLFVDDLKGESDIQSLQLRLFIKRFMCDFSYSNMKGFYLENTADYKPNWVLGKDPYIAFDDFGVKRYKVETTFIVNRDFSYKAILVQSQQQLKSAGSFMPSVSYAFSEISNLRAQGITVNDENDYDINFSAGYIHTFVFGKDNGFFFSFDAAPGLGVKYVKLLDNNNFVKKYQHFTNVSFKGGANLGYNSDHFFTGIQFNTSNISYNRNPETNIENSIVYLHLYFGYRFGAPKALDHIFDGIQDIITNKKS